MAKAIINAGVCGFVTEVTVESEDMITAALQVSSGCPGYAAMEGQSFEVDAMSACFGKVGQSEVYELFRGHCMHATCPVPAGALKAVEIACELALPQDVSIVLTK